MTPTSLAKFVFSLMFVSHALGQIVNKDLVGTWTSKSGKVLTGPGFYDPINEIIFEPRLTGISYSFTGDGFYEEALFRAISNPTTPTCPSAIVQWQHGRFLEHENSTLTLTPIAIDGRQILSRPCVASTTTLTHYNQSERFSKYEILTDQYNGRLRLNLWQWDGTPVNPMWLAYRPPQMLPTQTLNPTRSAAKVTAKATAKAQVDEENAARFWKRATWVAEVERRDARQDPDWHGTAWKKLLDASVLFWIGVGFVSVGGLLVTAF